MTTLPTNSMSSSLSKSSASVLVLLHGWGMNQGAFDEFEPYLNEHLNVVKLDLPGFGNAAQTIPEPYDLASIAEILVPQLPDECILAGWSLGGLVAQYIALNYAEKIKGLVTIASTPKFAASKCWTGISQEVLNTFQSQLHENYTGTLERFLAIQAMGSKTAKQDVKVIKSNLIKYPSAHPEALAKGLSLLESADLRASIGKIRTPTLRLYGRLDSLVPTSGIDNIHELHPTADSVVMPHAAHAPFISHPQQCADIITNFAFNLDRKEVFRR